MGRYGCKIVEEELNDGGEGWKVKSKGLDNQGH